MGKHYKDLTGQRFGKLEVIEMNGRTKRGLVIWKCKCDCGNEANIVSHYLISGATQSCGCYQREAARQRCIKQNEYDLSGNYGIGYTTKGEEFYFDLEDYTKIKDYCWYINNDGYLSAKKRDGSDRHILMHNIIMGQKYIDHIGGAKTRNDNRKNNLRIPSGEYGFDSYNQMNKQTQSNNKSGYPGISWHKRDNIWEVHITVKKKQIYLGRYENLDDAIKARKAAEEKYFGEYSYDNSQNTYNLNQESKKLCG